MTAAGAANCWLRLRGEENAGRLPIPGTVAKRRRCGALVTRPVVAHCFPDQRPDRGGVLSSSHGDDINLAPEFRVDDGSRDNSGMVDAEFRQKAKTLSRGAHRQDPVVALAAENRRPCDAALLPGQPFIELAVDPVEVTLVVQIPEADRIWAGKRMRRCDDDHHPLTK